MGTQGTSMTNEQTLSRRLRGVRGRTASIIAVAGLVSLGACSSGADPRDVTATETPFSASPATSTAASNPSPSTSPSPGSVVSSDGAFNFVVPAGWNLSTQPKTVTYLSSATAAHDVTPTIVVARSSVSPAPELDGTLRLTTLQAKQDGKSVAAAPDRSVGGERAVGFTATSTEKHVDLKRSYVMVAHDKVLYSITLTGAEADSSRDEAVLTSLLSSWSWTKKGDAGSTASGTTPAPVPTTTAPSSSPPSAASPTSSGSSSGSPDKPAPSSSGPTGTSGTTPAKSPRASESARATGAASPGKG